MDTVLHAGLSNAAVATAMALVLLPLARLLRRPALTHGVCILILVKLVTPPIWPVPVSWLVSSVATAGATDAAPTATTPVGEVAPVPTVVLADPFEGDSLIMADVGAVTPGAQTERLLSPALARHETPEASPAVPFPWLAVLAWCWLSGSALCLVSIVVRIRLLRRLLRFGKPAPGQVQAQARSLAAGLGLSACPGVWFVPGRLCPMLFGLLPRPRLFVSASLWARLDPAQRRTLLLHELAHFRRADHWVRPLEVAVTILYWWHPAVWLTRQALREAEEQCCDAWVVWGAPGAARDYAAALLAVVEFSSSSSSGARRSSAVPVMASGMGEFRNLKRRLIMMQQPTQPAAAARTLSRTGLAALFGLAVAVLPLAPTVAQTEERPAEATPPPATTAETPATPADAPATPAGTANPNQSSTPPATAGDEATRATPATPPANPYEPEESRPAERLEATPPPPTPAENFDGAVYDLLRRNAAIAAEQVGVADLRRAQAEVQKAEAELGAAMAAAKHAQLRLADAKAYLQATKLRAATPGGRGADKLLGDAVATTPKIDPDAAKRLEALEAEIRALRQELVGTRGSNERILMVYRLRNTEANEAASHLAKFFNDVGVTATPDARTNSLIFQGNPDRIDEVRNFLEQLDSGRTEQGDTPTRERRGQDVPAGR